MDESSRAPAWPGPHVLRTAAGIVATAALSALCVRGAWPLLFVFLVPWMRALDAQRSLTAALVVAWALSVAYTAAAFGWFGEAIGAYTQVGSVAGTAVLLLAAPLFQPQFIAFALVRRLARRRHGPLARALGGSAAWLVTEAFVPRLLDDTLGYGLHPSRLLRQAADIGGVAGLTLLLLLANEAVAVAIERRAAGLRALAVPLAAALAMPLLLAGYGLIVLPQRPLEDPAGATLRMGLVQAGIVDYERLRREKGAGAVVREVLDTHFAMSYDAVERQRAQAVIWSETVYPTTFGQPKSEAGAEFDREILQIVDAARVPFVFGTYERDAQGEYNAAAFVAPGDGLLGFYRKTRLFPFTERVPPWLDSPLLRRLLPWTGRWQPGGGARVMPLRLADRREVPVLPLICLDDMDSDLAIEGTRLGAQVILTMSNDSWFTAAPLGARLHLAAAAFRSIETRLPQFRVTSNGYSAVIDAQGSVLNETRMGERTLVIGEVPVRDPPRTLVVTWGPWVGRIAAGILGLFGVAAVMSAWRARTTARVRPEAPRGGSAIDGAHASDGSARVARNGDGTPESGDRVEDGGRAHAALAFAADVSVLPPAGRVAAAALRAIARVGLLSLGAVLLFGDGWLLSKPLVQIRLFAVIVLAPEAAAWLLLRAFKASASIEQGSLVMTRGARRLALPLRDVAAVLAWRLPLPSPGLGLQLQSGARWRYGLAGADAMLLKSAMAGATAVGRRASSPPSPAALYAHACLAAGSAGHGAGPSRAARLANPLVKFALLPLLIAIPAFRLHQHIAYGGTFGEWQAFGPQAWLIAFAVWWAGWAIGTVLFAAVLRVLIEAATLTTLVLRPEQTVIARRGLERLGLVLLYLGLPGWLLVRVLGN